MIHAGEDPRFIARRIIIHAAEAVGLADPMALVLANAAFQAAEFIGWPEARIPIAEAAIYIACANKSNSVIKAIDAALNDVRTGNILPVPPHLKDSHYSELKNLITARTINMYTISQITLFLKIIWEKKNVFTNLPNREWKKK